MMKIEDIKTVEESEKQIKKDNLVGTLYMISILPIALSGLGLLVAYERYGLFNVLPDFIQGFIGLGLAFGYLFLFLFVFCQVSCTPNQGRHSKYECIDKKIVNVKPIKEDNFIRYLEITFADGRMFKVLNESDNIDLTVNSKLILELSKSFHYAIPRSDYWEINQIIKVP